MCTPSWEISCQLLFHIQRARNAKSLSQYQQRPGIAQYLARVSSQARIILIIINGRAGGVIKQVDLIIKQADTTSQCLCTIMMLQFSRSLLMLQRICNGDRPTSPRELLELRSENMASR